MPRRLLLALLTLVAAPLALLGWVSATSMRDQQEVARQQLQGLVRSRLVEIDGTLAIVLDQHARAIAEQLSQSGSISSVLREMRLTNPLVRQGIFVSKQGVLAYPIQPVSDEPDDIALYAAISGMIDGRPEIGAATENTEQSSTVKGRGRSRGSPPPVIQSGQSQWQVWYMDEGAQLVLWFSRSDGATIGVLLERVRWVADLTAALPDSVLANPDETPVSTTPGFTALVDESRQTVYRWGEEGVCTDSPLGDLPLSSPLSSWRLEYHTPTEIVPPVQSTALYTSLAGIGIVLVALGGFVLTSVQRHMRAARNRVSFAGQVSHELRTPLTNIRLYAELAETDLDQLPEDEVRGKIAHRLSVIDTESRRLGRLVSGVLEMIRDDRNQRGPRIAMSIPDEVIEQALQHFRPSFESVGLSVHRDAGADQPARFDADILEMVLVNLLSNVEKYAVDGERVEITSRLDQSQLAVSVIDHGPGIPRRKHRAVFRAFTRLDDSIDAPSGTGIGLTIARRAARRHGGDLRLIPTDRGTHFQVTLPVS